MSGSVQLAYEYINENEIDDELKCTICHQPLDSPVSLSICNHTFCKKCIKFWLKHNQTCPTCRQHTKHHFGPSIYVPINTRIVLNQLNRLLIRCLLCNETNIQRCYWKNHEKICSKEIVSCPAADLKCPWKGSRDTLSIHLNNCTFEQIRPIIDQFKLTQVNFEKSIEVLQRKVNFLFKFITNGNLLIQKCKDSQCKYSGSYRYICSICYEYIQREQISFHICSGGCICLSCVNPQYSNHRKISNEKLSDCEKVN